MSDKQQELLKICSELTEQEKILVIEYILKLKEKRSSEK